MSVYDFVAKRMDGKRISLAEFKGKVLIVVNTSEYGGMAYQELQELYDLYAPLGVEILGIDFNYPTSILFQDVLDKNFTGDLPDASVKLNFTKFLIDRKGKVVGRYERTVVPPAMQHDVESCSCVGQAT
ncbi:TPA: hypothetical protein DDW35_13530 [Candidatus Sumerlaeota bacterium]|jgi:glutathione peroxidase|nr:hypothetical protein [Candidatus Sumerlaeota bacterium]